MHNTKMEKKYKMKKNSRVVLGQSGSQNHGTVVKIDTTDAMMTNGPSGSGTKSNFYNACSLFGELRYIVYVMTFFGCFHFIRGPSINMTAIGVITCIYSLVIWSARAVYLVFSIMRIPLDRPVNVHFVAEHGWIMCGLLSCAISAIFIVNCWKKKGLIYCFNEIKHLESYIEMKEVNTNKMKRTICVTLAFFTAIETTIIFVNGYDFSLILNYDMKAWHCEYPVAANHIPHYGLLVIALSENILAMITFASMCFGQAFYVALCLKLKYMYRSVNEMLKADVGKGIHLHIDKVIESHRELYEKLVDVTLIVDDLFSGYMAISLGISVLFNCLLGYVIYFKRSWKHLFAFTEFFISIIANCLASDIVQVEVSFKCFHHM